MLLFKAHDIQDKLASILNKLDGANILHEHAINLKYVSAPVSPHTVTLPNNHPLQATNI